MLSTLHALYQPMSVFFSELNLYERVAISLFAAFILAIAAMSSWSLILIAAGHTAGGGPLGMVMNLTLKMANTL